MKLEHFGYLLEINRLHSISAAARFLHIRQTTLSAMLKTVEEEVGFPIFQRTPTGVETTPAGEQFMALAWEISVKSDELFSLKQRASNSAQIINLLLAPTIVPMLPIALTERYHRFEVCGNLAFHECLSSEIVTKLTEGAANIGVAYLTRQEMLRARETTQIHDIEIEALMDDQIYLLVSKGHPFAQMQTVSMDLVHSQGLATAKTMRDDAILGRAMLSFPRITAFSDVNIMIRAVLEQGLVAFLPKGTLLSAKHIDRSQYCFLSVEGMEKENRVFLCLLHKKEGFLRYQEKILVSCIREHFTDFLRRYPEFSVGKKEVTANENGLSAVSDRN